MNVPYLKIIAFCSLLNLTLIGQAQTIQVSRLTVDLLHNPDLQVVNGYPVVGFEGGNGIEEVRIGNRQPVLGWELVGTGAGTKQSAYQIILSERPDSIAKGVGTIWDSGRVLSDASTNIVYEGGTLAPNTRYAWAVKVWDEKGEASAWSPISRFRTADALTEYQTSFYPLQKTDEAPREIHAVDNSIRIDFGRAAFGQLRLTLNSPDGGEQVTVRLGEAVLPDGSINRKPGGTIRYAAYPLSLKKGIHTYQLQFPADKRNTGAQAVKMPAYIGEVLPFRYVELEGYTGKLEETDVVRSNVNYPFDDFASQFESSDSVLNAVWELCKYTVKATTFAGIYVDGDRERIPYEADAYINQLCHYSIDNEYSLARRSHEYLLHHATWPTEWILQSVLMAYHDYLYTGDLRSANYYYDDLKAKLLLPLRDANGLISTQTGNQNRALMNAIHYQGDSLRDIVDWPHTGGFGMEGNGETDGFVFTPYNAVVNAFHYRALKDMAELAGALGKKDDAIGFTQQAEETYHAFQSLLWDKKKGVFHDGVDTDHASLHTNMMALTFGLVPQKDRDRVMAFIRSRGMACSVYGSQFLMDATYMAGDADYGLSLLTSQSDRSWYNMIRAGSTMTMEAWDNKYKPNQDWNHVWGAVPANIIPRKLMGIEPLQPGWKTFRIRPQIGSLEWATIKMPTLKGDIHVSCKQGATDYRMQVVIPFNTNAFVELPGELAGNRRIKINDDWVKANVVDGRMVLPPLAAGTYEIIVTK